MPDNVPYIKDFNRDTPVLLKGMDTIAPSGKFCIAIPIDKASAPMAVIPLLPDK